MTAWLLGAVLLAGLTVGGGWLAAWQADRNAVESWSLLAQDRAAQATVDAGTALDHAQMRLRALSRSLAASPSAARARVRFDIEAPLFLAEDLGGAFVAVALVADVPAEDRDGFIARGNLEILAPDRNPALGAGPAAVAIRVAGADDGRGAGILFPGLDLTADPRLARCVTAAMQAPERTVTGPSFPASGRRLAAVAADAGEAGLAVGLIDLTSLLEHALGAGLPEGLSVAVAERLPDEPEAEAMTIFRHGAEIGMPLLEWQTRHVHGGAAWRLEWRADERFRGGPGLDFGAALRLGSVAVGGLLLAALGFAAAARRRERERNRESALLRSTADRMTEGICVLDRALTVQAANENYYALYGVPEEMRRPGVTLPEILRMQLNRGDFGALSDPEGFIAARLAHIRGTGDEIVEEVLPDGRTLEIRRQRMPDGRLVSLYLDITERRRVEMERAAASALMAATFEHMSDGLTAVDRHGRLLQWNGRFLEFFGIPRSIVRPGTPLRGLLADCLGADDLTAVGDALDELPWADVDAVCEAVRDEPVAMRTVVLSGERWVQLSNRTVPGRGYVITFTDVTERMRISDALRRSEERYALAAQGANDGLWDWSLDSGHFYTSQRWRDMLGLGRDPIAEAVEEWFDRVHPKDIEEVQQQIEDHLEGRTDHLQAEFRVLHSDGAYIWAMARAIAVRDDAGRAIRLVGSMTDITERKRAEEKLIRDALYDTVTGLPNRALLLDRIEQERRRTARAADGRFAVLLLDLDRFKVVNDSLGHDLGDALLIEVARRLERALKPGDSLARLSGDEFAILLTDIDGGDQALDAVHWLQTDLAAAFVIGNQEVFTSASAGIALAGQDFLDAEEMLRAADIAMYKAKEDGQSSAAVFDPQMQTRAISQMQMENDLRRAVERDEIQMLYQPIVSLRTGQLAGVEALARWRHPDRGTVVPADFIPLAEDTGLITAIGTEALRMACRQLRAWQEALGDAAPATMSVNLSSRQLQDPDLVREIELILKREKVDGARLKLEVTESMIMQNPEMTTRMLGELKALGVALSIDDFGTGYSSLSYLHRFPFDTLKIDRSFVASMDDKPENMEIVRSITLLAHTLGMDTIAEGVESARHLAPLKDVECEFGQGYFFATPQPAERIVEMIRDGAGWDV